jgi:NRE family putative nickel resistance protein-like MFS transporter
VTLRHADDPASGSLWKNHSFVLLFSAQVISLLGSGATTIGLALFAYQLAGSHESTVVVGNALTLRIFAFLLFSQPAGVLADRVNRKAVLIGADLLRAGLLALLPFVTTIWHVYALIFTINAATAFFTPTYEASVPTVVGEANIVKALSLSRVAVDVETVAAPGVAALIVGLVGARWVFWFDGLTYVLSAALIVAVALPRITSIAQKLSRGPLLLEITYGVRAIWREPALRQALVLSLVEALAGAVAIVATVAYVRDVLGRDETSAALAIAAVGLGSSVAAIALGRATGRYELRAENRAALHGKRHAWTRRAMLMGGFSLGIALLPGFLEPALSSLLAMWALNGAGQALIAISSSTLLAEHTFEEERGRVYAAHFAMTHACWLVMYPVIGHAANIWGTPNTFTWAAAVCILITMAAALFRPGRDEHVHDRSNEQTALDQEGPSA